MKPLLRFGVAALATWRVTHLLVNEDGPADAIVRLRARLGESQFGALMDCFHCASVWVAIPFAFFAARKPADRLAAWLALSGAACLIQEITDHDHTSTGDRDELLRKETSSV
ncbi:MAG TPA: DUF1360 domain-containing protein [Terracidiphilus sp.]